MSRPYSKAFPRNGSSRRYLLDDIPARMWVYVRAVTKRDGISIRAWLLGLVREQLRREGYTL